MIRPAFPFQPSNAGTPKTGFRRFYVGIAAENHLFFVVLYIGIILKLGNFMYKRKANGWLKHWDFILIDLIVIQVAYVLSLFFAGYLPLYETSLYRNMAIILEAINLIVILVFSTFRDVLKKGHYLTFVSCLQQGILIGVTTILYLFVIQKGQDFSRLTILYTAVIYVLLSYICRELWKSHLLKYYEYKT